MRFGEAVREITGTLHGFLALRTIQGETLAAGELVQLVRGNQVVTKLVLHFKDGSLDDESTVYTQRGAFQLVNNHHVQRGPSFPQPLDMQIDTATGVVTYRSDGVGGGKIETKRFDLPVDLANGLLPTLLMNLPESTRGITLPFVAATPEPRLVNIDIARNGNEAFWIGGIRRTAARYRLKIRLGGLAGLFAPAVGKEPADIHVWILEGEAPLVVRLEGQFYAGGPVWALVLTSPSWSRNPSAEDWPATVR